MGNVTNGDCSGLDLISICNIINKIALDMYFRVYDTLGFNSTLDFRSVSSKKLGRIKFKI